MKKKQPRLTVPGLRILGIFYNAGFSSEMCGSDIRRETGIFSGTLYPILLRFEGAGWLVSRWEDVDPVAVGRPRRRLYKISELGALKLKEAMSEIQIGASTWAIS